MNPAQNSCTNEAWLTAGRFVVLLGLLVFVTFPEVVLGTRTFIFRDYGLFSYPVAFFQRECFWRGELPFWNPYSLCGVPFLAQWNTLCLYPPALLYLLFPLTWALSFFCLVHLIWGGLGMFLLARNWTGNSLAGALAGVVFSFNGLSLNFLMWPSHIATFSWLPWVLWLVPRGWREGGHKLLLGTAAGALQMLAGAPETTLFTWIILGVLACADWLATVSRRQRDLPQGRLLSITSCMQMPVRFAGMMILITLICSAQLVPFFELLAHSQRDTGYGSSGWPMPTWGLANFLVPLFGTYQTPGGVHMQHGQYWTSSYYAGTGTVLLVALAAWHAHDLRVRMLCALVILALLLALGNAGLVYPALRYCVPGLGLARYPVKFVIIVLGLVPLLAAVGLQRISADAGGHRRSKWYCTYALLVLIYVILASQRRASADTRWMTIQNGLGRAGFLVLTTLLVSLLAKKGHSLNNPKRILLSLLLIVAFWLDFVTHVPTQNPSVSPLVYSPSALTGERNWKPVPKLGGSRAMLSPAALNDLKYHSLSNIESAFLLSRLGLLADCNLLENIPQAHGFFSLAPAEANEVCSVWYVQTNRDFSRLLDFMGVSQVSSPGHTFDWSSRPSAMPLVTAGAEPVFAEDQVVFAALSQVDTDFRRTAFLPLEASRSISARRQPNAEVDSFVFTDRRLAVRIRSPAPSILVIAQAWYPAWKAYVDGEPARLWRANYAFQALQVPAGEHQVQLKYEDQAFLAGAAVSGVGLIAYILLWYRMHRHTRRPNELQPEL